uniref:Uncharacterized protein n=1 Tax=Aegilops tauschii TaxID=37682 RepID=R7W5P8_AEGTA
MTAFLAGSFVASSPRRRSSQKILLALLPISVGGERALVRSASGGSPSSFPSTATRAAADREEAPAALVLQRADPPIALAALSSSPPSPYLSATSELSYAPLRGASPPSFLATATRAAAEREEAPNALVLV